MAKGNRETRRRLQHMASQKARGTLNSGPAQPREVKSLLDAMQDGNEYQSIVDATPPVGTNLMDEILRAVTDIEKIRGRPCMLYVGNVVKKDESGEASVISSDDLPFSEMVAKVPQDQRAVDIFIATNGGSGQQVANFVNHLRPRFDEVEFLVPSFCMSAGTLFVLSGERIWMTDRGRVGPIDPQVPTAGGRYVPAQALLHLVGEVQRVGDEAMAKGGSVPWAYVRLIDSLDKKELGEAITATQYAQTMATQFLISYKLRNWTVRATSRQAVTPAIRLSRAQEIATALCSHDRWKSHGHAISREVLWSELKLQIDHPDQALNRAMFRLWALLTYVFDKTPMVKIIASAQYRYIRHVQVQIIQSGVQR